MQKSRNSVIQSIKSAFRMREHKRLFNGFQDESTESYYSYKNMQQLRPHSQNHTFLIPQKKTPPVTFNTGCWHHPAFYYSPPESKYSLIHHSRLFCPDISYTTLPLTPDPDHCCCVRPWIPEARSHGAVVKLTGKRECLCFSSSLVFHLSKPCV